MKTAYLDCFSGVSGDMLLGALVDVGLPEDVLPKVIDTLGLTGCSIAISKTEGRSLGATRVEINVTEEQPTRHLADLENILVKADLRQPVREKALAVFRSLAEAEAAVHGYGADEVHFHEVGAVDALVDIVGVVSGLDHLGITRLSCSALPISHGWVRCEHGELPLPAPAAIRLLQGKPVYGVNLEQELVTPTGAALIHVLADEYGPMPPMRLAGTGYGAGKNRRSDGRPNLLRLIIGEAHLVEEAQQVEVIETALDDWNPEIWPHVAGQLFDNGALDVILIPVQMKKGRPGFLLKIICEPAHAQPLKHAILRETTTIGLRFHTEQRMTLPREIITLQTEFGPIAAKKIITPDGAVVAPEYEECRRIALARGIPIREVYSQISCYTGDFR